MDAVKTMSARTLSALRPVGNALQLTATGTATADEQLFATLFDTARHQVHWTSSGTAALALAITHARNSAATTRPEVILPAYGCPDLIAAALFAQVTPVLVDIQPDSPQFDPERLNDAITPDTVAIVSATLLGIRGDEMTLRGVIGKRPIALIEDSAQWFPHDSRQTFFGDMVVVSFGRGKPLNLLGGGALLTRTPLAQELAPLPATDNGPLSTIKFIGKALAYNLLIHPLPYGVVTRLPLLDIGATRYHALAAIDAINPNAHRLLAVNLAHYCRRDTTVRHRWADAIATLNTRFPGLKLTDLAQRNRVPADYALLRYPVAVEDPSRRDRICEMLTAQGLGASIMYPAALADLPDVPLATCRVHSQANARLFAQRFLTLPTHEAVTATIVDQTCMTIARARPID